MSLSLSRVGGYGVPSGLPNFQSTTGKCVSISYCATMFLMIFMNIEGCECDLI